MQGLGPAELAAARTAAGTAVLELDQVLRQCTVEQAAPQKAERIAVNLGHGTAAEPKVPIRSLVQSWIQADLAVAAALDQAKILDQEKPVLLSTNLLRPIPGPQRTQRRAAG